MSRKNKYVPHLAEFFFRPEFNWSRDEALSMYNTNNNAGWDKIIYEDCIKGMESMDPESVDLVVADPPFGINFSGLESIYNRNKCNVVKGYREIDDYDAFTSAWIGALPRIMKKTASAFIISGYTNLEYVLRAIRESGLVMKNHIIWKYQFGPFTSRKWVSSHYHILWVVKDPRRYFYHRITHYNPDVWDDIGRTYKPNEKKNGTKLPVELVRRMIDFTTKPGDLVFDPFMGNGTTAVAAKANFRHFFGFEINRSLKEIIEDALAETEIGRDYIPYEDRLKTPEELAAQGPEWRRAYRIYLEKIKAEKGEIKKLDDCKVRT